MTKPDPPKPPPMKKYKSFGWGELLVNEYETVDWYTDMGKLVDPNILSTQLPKTWLRLTVFLVLICTMKMINND